MSIFRLLDETVRGTILFIFGFLYVTAVLIRHPVVGPNKIFRAYKSSDSQRLSSLTYLALAMLLTIVLLPQVADDRLGGIMRRTLDAASGIFGGQMSSFVPVILGTFVATALLTGLLRILAGARKLNARRRERFVSGSEYAFGVAALMLVVVVAVYAWAFRLEQSGRVSAFVIMLLVGAAGVIPYLVIGYLLVAQFWTGLMRDTRFLRMVRRGRDLRMIRRKQGWQKFKETQKAYRLQSVGFRPGEKVRFLSYSGRSLRLAALVGMIIVSPLLVAGVAILTGSYVATLASAENPPEIWVTCDLASPQPTARAAVWNRSGRPLVGWAGNLHLYAQIYQRSDGRESVIPLGWQPQPPNGRLTDLLRPNDSIELAGAVQIPPEAAAAIRDRTYSTCFVEIGAPVAEAPGAVQGSATR